jgi:hypothetical protein
MFVFVTTTAIAFAARGVRSYLRAIAAAVAATSSPRNVRRPRV